ncbi:MAG: copper-binding protein, partial [Limisphaerales bacterium]
MPYAQSAPAPAPDETGAQIFAARGVVREFSSNDQTVTISHEAVSNYMSAMTMPFKVRNTRELAGLHSGDEVTFRLHVTETDSWVDRITRIGT